MVRLGSTLSVQDVVHLGSTLYFGSTDTYMRYDSGTTELQVTVAGNKRLSFSAIGGGLHGTWSSESIISASDRNLKKTIVPLYQTLLTNKPITDVDSSQKDVKLKNTGLQWKNGSTAIT